MRKENSTKFPKERFCKVKILAHYIQGTTAIIYIHNRGIMRLYYNGKTIEGLKKYLEKHSMHKMRQKPNIGIFRESRRETLGGAITSLKESLDRNFLEEKDKEDEKAMRELMFQGDNMSFSG